GKRQEYAEAGKEAWLNTSAGKTYTFKQSFIATASAYIGTPYKYGSTNPNKGFDCSGLVYVSAKENQLSVPRSSSLMAHDAPHIPWKKAEMGDLVFFGSKSKIDHVAIVEKNKGRDLIVIHSTTGRGVIRENILESPYWKKRIRFAVPITAYQKGTIVKS
ncbi:MAG TPA: C40 family peptidase, partial [Saprospiraceae bacterium]|nr:C40 family peptidase [Saprospiraceae bacterium]